MKNVKFFSLLFFTILMLSCEQNNSSSHQTEQPKTYPVTLNQSDEEQIIEIFKSGIIQFATYELNEGGKEHRYVLTLNYKGKKQKYEEIGYRHGEVEYYEIIVTNPYDFNVLLDKYNISVKGGVIND